MTSTPGAPLLVRWPTAAAAIAALALAAHLPALSNGFVWDDRLQVLANHWLTSWKYVPEIFRHGVWDFEGEGLTNYYRPLMHLAYLLVFQAFGPAAWAYHLLNLLVDATVAVLVMRVAQQLVDPKQLPRVGWPALAAGMLFATHPVHSEPVAWVAALPDLAATALGMGALLVHLGQLQRRTATRAAIGATFALYACGLFFKEPLFVLPVVAVAAELLLGRGQPPVLRGSTPWRSRGSRPWPRPFSPWRWRGAAAPRSPSG